MTEEQATDMITPAARFYRLHREEQLAKKKEEYNNRPDIIAKRQERQRKKAEKEAEKEAKLLEKENKLKERIAIAENTCRKIKQKSDHSLLPFLETKSPAL